MHVLRSKMRTTVNIREEAENIAKIERYFILKYGLGYEELQNIPYLKLLYWRQLDIQDEKQRQFELMKQQNGRRNY